MVIAVAVLVKAYEEETNAQEKTIVKVDLRSAEDDRLRRLRGKKCARMKSSYWRHPRKRQDT